MAIERDCPDCGGPVGSSTYTDFCKNKCGWESGYYHGPDSMPDPDEAEKLSFRPDPGSRKRHYPRKSAV